jgi:hypothetical protein
MLLVLVLIMIIKELLEIIWMDQEQLEQQQILHQVQQLLGFIHNDMELMQMLQLILMENVLD